MTDPLLPPVHRYRELGVTAQRAFTALTEEIGAWWPRTFSATGDPAAAVAFTGDRLIETGVDGTEHVWGEVLRWEPPFGLVMTWHPGRDAPAPASEVELRVTALSSQRCLVEVFHRGWERLADPVGMRNEYENGWPLVVREFAEFVADEEEPELWHVLAHSPGPSWRDDRRLPEQDGIEKHFAFLELLESRGLLVAAGPLPSSPGHGQTLVRGIDTAELTELATTKDAAVTDGLLQVNVVPWVVVSQPTRE